MPKTTEYLQEQINSMTCIEEVIELCREHDDDLVEVSKALNALLIYYRLTVPEFIKKCGFSRGNRLIKGWFDGTSEPRGRAQYMKIALGLGMDLNEANRLLVRVGGCGRLYPKNIRDAAYIHTLQTKGDHAEYQLTYAELERELEQCVFEAICSELPSDYVGQRNEILQCGGAAAKEMYERLDALDEKFHSQLGKAQNKLRRELLKGSYVPEITDHMMQGLTGDTDMKMYVRYHWREFVTQNWRLSEHINALVKHSAYVNEGGKTIDTIGSLVDDMINSREYDNAISQKAAHVIKKEYSDLCTKGKTISRNVIIVLGLLMNQDADGINIMLDIAGMEALCPRRGIEAALIFALNLCSDCYPETKFSSIKDELCSYTRNTENDTSGLIELIFSDDELETDFTN